MRTRAALPRRLALPGFSAALVLVPGAGSPAASEAAAAWEALRPGAIVLFRHAIAPGTGDPSGMRLGDCSTQRNLDEAGRAQARRIGEAVRAQGVAVGAVLASRWCRAAETADLAFPGRARPEPALDSFFAERGEGPARTAEARRILLGWSGPGALVVVTHQVNITALTGVVPSSGEGVVLRRGGGDLVVVGRVKP
jgi:phosphohistidine phosphatase SixA